MHYYTLYSYRTRWENTGEVNFSANVAVDELPPLEKLAELLNLEYDPRFDALDVEEKFFPYLSLSTLGLLPGHNA